MKWLVLAVMVAIAAPARAQQATGAIVGRVLDPQSGAPVAGARVAITSNASLPQLATSDADGRYRVTQLLPGPYIVTVRWPDGRLRGRYYIRVAAGATAIASFVIDRRYLTDVPVVARTFGDVIGAGPRAVNDGSGVAYSGSTSLENRYFVDGIDTTELRYGQLATVLPVELVDQVRATDVGAGPEYGRATGGFAEVVTRHGTNELHGSVFGSLAPSWLAAAPHTIPHDPQTIDVSARNAYTADFGFELGGPIVKDRLWFYVGAAPQLVRTDYTRRIESETDCRKVQANGTLSACQPQLADGIPDVDPRTGFHLVDTVASEVREAPTRAYPILARIDAAVTPEQQGSLTALVVPSTAEQPGLYGPASAGTRTTGLASDVGARWSSKLLADALELDAQLAWHRASSEVGALDPSLADVAQRTIAVTTFSALAPYQSEAPAAIAACSDSGASDRYPRITNCPFGEYTIGGPGLVTRDVQDRRSARVAATSRLGAHAVTAGLAVDDETEQLASAYSGGYTSTDYGGGLSIFDRFVALAPPGTTDPSFDHTCANGSTALPCRWLTGLAATAHEVSSIDEAAYVRDVWEVLPELVVDLGVRDEVQRLRYPSGLRGTTDPVTGVHYGTNFVDLGNQLAPRVGISYDPTREGRALLFAHWGRYYESLPLDLVDKIAAPHVQEIWTSSAIPTAVLIYPSEPLHVAPALAAEHIDELVLGGRLALARDWTVSATFVDRRLRDVIEDVAQNGGLAFTLANPGASFGYDSPSRVYDALTLSLDRRFSRLYLRASYTYSRTAGDYPGDVYYDQPSSAHRSPQYDERELLANHLGVLPQDRTHVFKFDESYAYPVGRRASLVVGVRERALSGPPQAALGTLQPNGYYDDALLLPRSAFPRLPAIVTVDVHVAYRRRLPHRAQAELYADVFNLFDAQPVTAVDDSYAAPLGYARPISGGAYADLIWIKSNSQPYGTETSAPLQRSTTFQHPTAYASPLATRLGFRLAF